MADLPKRALGRTGFAATILGYGAMELRGAPAGPDITDDDARKILNAVLDAGINLIDTSIDYGRSEELIGRHIAHRRSGYFLASKCGCVPGAGMAAGHIHTAENIRAGVEHSLRLLNTDYLDAVQFHRSITRREFEEHGALDAALKLKREGKVRFIGVSGTLPHLDEQIGMGVFDVFQIPYSALQRDHENAIAPRVEGRSRDPHSRRRRSWRTERLACPRLLHDLIGDDAPAVGNRATRRVAGRNGSHGVHAAVHDDKPRSRHHDRGNARPGTSPAEYRGDAQGTASRRCGARGDAAPGPGGFAVGAVESNLLR